MFGVNISDHEDRPEWTLSYFFEQFVFAEYHVAHLYYFIELSFKLVYQL